MLKKNYTHYTHYQNQKVIHIIKNNPYRENFRCDEALMKTKPSFQNFSHLTF